MTIFINGKQKRERRPVLIDGLDPDEFYLRNADSIALHQDGLWECMAEAKQATSLSPMRVTRIALVVQAEQLQYGFGFSTRSSEEF